jgi:hypothetical protein
LAETSDEPPPAEPAPEARTMSSFASPAAAARAPRSLLVSASATSPLPLTARVTSMRTVRRCAFERSFFERLRGAQWPTTVGRLPTLRTRTEARATRRPCKTSVARLTRLARPRTLKRTTTRLAAFFDGACAALAANVARLTAAASAGVPATRASTIASAASASWIAPVRGDGVTGEVLSGPGRSDAGRFRGPVPGGLRSHSTKEQFDPGGDRL